MNRINEDFTTRGKLTDVGRWYVTRFLTRVSKRIPVGSRVLDAGAGECAYKSWFAHCRYIAVDLGVGETAWNYTNLDSFGRLESLPFASDSFDAIVCTQVLEHVERPWDVLVEFLRILKPGGSLYLSAPMSHAEHQVPYDFFRYTSWGLRSLSERAKFEIIEMEAFGGMFVRWAYEAPRAMAVLGRWAESSRPRRLMFLSLALLMRPAVRLWQVVFLWLDRFDEEKADPFGWGMTARKPAGLEVGSTGSKSSHDA